MMDEPRERNGWTIKWQKWQQNRKWMTADDRIGNGWQSQGPAQSLQTVFKIVCCVSCLAEWLKLKNQTKQQPKKTLSPIWIPTAHGIIYLDWLWYENKEKENLWTWFWSIWACDRCIKYLPLVGLQWCRVQTKLTLLIITSILLLPLPNSLYFMTLWKYSIIFINCI